MARELEVDAGVPITAALDGAGDIVRGVLPPGRYATLTHVGHPAGLSAATQVLLEIYLTDPGQEPDMSKWVTQLAFRLAG